MRYRSSTRTGCVLIGCGPSLNTIDIERLSDFDTITFNRAYVAFKDWGFYPTYYACIDRVVLPDNADEIRAMSADSRIERLFLRDTAELFGIPEGGRVTYLHIINGAPFSTDLKNLGMFGNVGAVSLQILASLRYTRVVLVGVDARYVQNPPDILVEEVDNYIEGTRGDTFDYVHLQDNDPNHFCPNYYGQGRRENTPNVAKAIEGWRRAGDACPAFGLEVRNASPGSALQCFSHLGLEDALEWLQNDGNERGRHECSDNHR